MDIRRGEVEAVCRAVRCRGAGPYHRQLLEAVGTAVHWVTVNASTQFGPDQAETRYGARDESGATRLIAAATGPRVTRSLSHHRLTPCSVSKPELTIPESGQRWCDFLFRMLSPHARNRTTDTLRDILELFMSSKI